MARRREKVDLSGTVFRESPDWNDDDLSLCHISIVSSERVWQCAAVALRGKMSKREEVFFGSACYTSQRPDDQSHIPDAERGASDR